MIQKSRMPGTRWLQAGAFCLSLLVGLAGSSLAADEAELIVELGREAIYEGESVRYRVTLNHVENPSPPQLEALDTDFEVKPAGERSLNSHRVTIINGRRSEIRRFGRAYDYLLTPRRAGILEIPAPVAQVDGRLLRGRALTLEVVAPQDQDTVVLEIRSDRESVYPMQQFTVTLHVGIKALPEPLSSRHPIELLQQLNRRVPLPALAVPWVDDDKLPGGVKPERSWRKWLENLQSRSGAGFSLNNLGNSSVFSLFDERPMAFLPPSGRVEKKDQAGVDAQYWNFEFARTFTPHQLGSLSFGPVTLKGTFVTEVNSQNEATTRQIYAVARPLVVTAKDVPSDGRPKSYIGAIGQFEVTNRLAPTRAKVGDPLTLTVTLRGQGTLEAARAPDLAQIPAVTDQFRVYEATEETREGQRQFTYSLRPLQAGTVEFPPIPLSYFDVRQEKFITLRSEPISLVVEEAEQLDDDEIALAATGNGRRAAIEASQDGLLANINDPSVLVDQSVDAPRWFLLFACMGGGYVVVLVVSDHVRQFFGDGDLQRRRLAPGRARRRLQEAGAQVQGGQLRGAVDALGGALIGLVADVAGIEESGLTSAEVEMQLRNMGVETEAVRRMSELLEMCDGVRYGASHSALQGLDDDTRLLLEELISILKRKKFL
ncbi:MAG: hypothetical protein CMJ81_19555 [Planctomycetaceae bacterium]|nr:hypothetical protein [Planctomycetaceae bacterium]